MIKPRSQITPDAFLRVWQESRSVAEVCDRLAVGQREAGLPTLSKKAAVARAWYYRRKGMAAKFMKVVDGVSDGDRPEGPGVDQAGDRCPAR